MYLSPLSSQFDMQVANISVLIEQEVTTPALRTFPAISVVMGKYSNVALYVKLQDWSSKVTHGKACVYIP